MENSLVEKISKLKQKIATVVIAEEKKSVDLTAYLTHPRKPTVDLEAFKAENPNFKHLLDEKQQRIYELEEELTHSRYTHKRKEQEIRQKYEQLLSAAKLKYEELTRKRHPQEENHRVKDLQDQLARKETEYQEFYNENYRLHEELAAIKGEFEETKRHLAAAKQLFDSEHGTQELQQLFQLKQNLECDIANLESKKSLSVNELFEEFEEKYDKAVEIAELWKHRSDQLGLKFFTFLRALRMDVYELKNAVVGWLEEATTEASSVVAISVKKYRCLLDESDSFIKEVVKENQRLRASMSKLKKT